MKQYENLMSFIYIYTGVFFSYTSLSSFDIVNKFSIPCHYSPSNGIYDLLKIIVQ